MKTIQLQFELSGAFRLSLEHLIHDESVKGTDAGLQYQVYRRQLFERRSIHPAGSLCLLEMGFSLRVAKYIVAFYPLIRQSYLWYGKRWARDIGAFQVGPVQIGFAEIALRRSACLKSASLKFLPFRSTSLKFAPLRLPFLKSALLRSTPVKCHAGEITRLTSTPLRFTPCNIRPRRDGFHETGAADIHAAEIGSDESRV